jgi:flagellar export protein FliJ
MRVSGTSFETVIWVKDFQVKKAQRELAVISVNRISQEGALTNLEEQQSTAMTDAVRTMKAKAVDLQTSQAFLQSLARQIQKQVQKVEEVLNQEEGKRDELLGKSQSKQMIEKIDQRRKDEQERELERKAQRVSDVIAQRMKSGL